MAYWRMNTDRDARNDVSTCDLWYSYRMAFAGDKLICFEHAKDFENLLIGDGIFMHHNKAGIVGYGIIKENWDEKAYESSDKMLYIDGESEEIYEYRIKVKWLPEYDRRQAPLKFSQINIYHRRTIFPVRESDANNILAKLSNKTAI